MTPEEREQADKLWKVVLESHSDYRKSGLGLSATFITLAVLLIHQLPVETMPYNAWHDTCKLLLIQSILSAITIQVFHYLGTRQQAIMDSYCYDSLFGLVETSQDEAVEEIAKFQKIIRRWVGLADATVLISLCLFTLGATLWIFVNPKFDFF